MLPKILRNTPKTSGAKTPEPAEGHIYLVSMATFPNYGDELIAARWLTYLAEQKPDTDVWLDVREPGTATALFAGLHPRLHVVNTIFRAIHEHLHGDPRSPADKVLHLGSPKYDLALLALREASTVHLLGGGFINAVWPHNQLIIDAMRAARQVGGGRLLATGQGLMPRIEETFEGFDHISVRDQPSAEALGIPLGLDDAFLMPPPAAQPQPRPSDPELYICVQSDALDSGSHHAFVDYTRQQVKALGIPRHKTFYVEAIPGDDRAGYEALADLIADEGFIPFAHFWQSGFAFSPHQIWVTSRFHHHLMGAAHGARGIALSGKAGYYDIKHGSILGLGSNWKIADLRTIYRLEDLATPADFSTYLHQKRQEADALYPRA